MSNPLKGRVCHGLMTAGIRLKGDLDPVCMLGRCSNYPSCLHTALYSQRQIRKLQKKTQRRP